MTTDTERLDWFEEHVNDFRYIREELKMNNIVFSHWHVWTYKEGSTRRPTLREAIDASMDIPPEIKPVTKYEMLKMIKESHRLFSNFPRGKHLDEDHHCDQLAALIEKTNQ